MKVLVQVLTVVLANAIKLSQLIWSCKTLMVLCDLIISFALKHHFIDKWVYLDVSNFSSQGELECECEIEMFLAQMQFLMGCNL